MSKKFKLLLSFVLALGVNWAGAEELTVKVAGDRTAVVHVVEATKPDAQVSGSIKSSIDLKGGKGALNGDLILKAAPELKDAKAGLFAKMTGKTIEAIGYLDAKIPPSPEAPKSLDLKAETVTEGDQSAANFDLSFLVPYTGATAAPTGSGEAKLEGDFKAIKTSGKFDFAGDEVKASEVPFQSLNFEITEIENKTTVSFTIKVPKTSEMAPQLDSLPGMAPMLEEQLKSANIKYEGLEFPAPTEEGESKVGKAKLTVLDIRATIKPFLGFASGELQAQVGPDVNVQKAFEDMLEVKLDKLAFSMNIQDKKVDGTFEFNASNLGKFYEGYTVLLPAMQQQSNQDMAREMGEFGPIFVAFMELSNEQAAAAIKAAVDSNMGISGDMNFKLEPKEKDISLSAAGKLLTTNYKAYVAKSKEVGLPVAERAVGALNLNLKDGGNLVGDAYLVTDGEIVGYYKGLLGKAATKANAPKEVVDAINGLTLNEVATKMVLEGDKLTVLGKSDTSDLSNVTKMILAKAAPQLDALLVGANMDIQIVDKGNSDVKVFFENFLPGKTDAQIKEALGLPASAAVKLDAPAGDTKLVAVEVPEIAIDGKLAEIQAKHQELVASSPSDMGGGGGGGSKKGLIALGVLLLVGVGGFLMFGKKS